MEIPGIFFKSFLFTFFPTYLSNPTIFQEKTSIFQILYFILIESTKNKNISNKTPKKAKIQKKSSNASNSNLNRVFIHKLSTVQHRQATDIILVACQSSQKQASTRVPQSDRIVTRTSSQTIIRQNCQRPYRSRMSVKLPHYFTSGNIPHYASFIRSTTYQKLLF